MNGYNSYKGDLQQVASHVKVYGLHLRIKPDCVELVKVNLKNRNAPIEEAAVVFAMCNSPHIYYMAAKEVK